ncbi:MAG: ORF6N domain-containing protein [Bacteroidota bacterium]
MKSRRTRAQVVPKVESLILTVRGTRVILDADLAAVYGVTTKRLNEQVKRNRKRLWKCMPALGSQNATAWRGGIRGCPKSKSRVIARSARLPDGQEATKQSRFFTSIRGRDCFVPTNNVGTRNDWVPGLIGQPR